MEFNLENLQRLLDNQDGVFYWKEDRGSRKLKGKRAGCVNKHIGYDVITVLDRHVYAHRLNFFMTYGYWPKSIDHKDGNKLNNSITNLREVTQQQNLLNRSHCKKSKTKAKCVYYEHGAYVVRIGYQKKRYYGGRHKLKADAIIVAKRILKELHGQYYRY